MKTYFSAQRVDLTATPKIRSYHDKTISVVEQVHEWEGNVHVAAGDVPDADKCSVNVWATNLPAMPGDTESVSQSADEHASAPFFKTFLTQDAVDLISPNEDDALRPLVLKIP